MLNNEFHRCYINDDVVATTYMNDEEPKVSSCMENAKQTMYPDTKFTKFSVIVCLFYVKCLNKVTHKTFDMLLEFLR